MKNGILLLLFPLILILQGCCFCEPSDKIDLNITEIESRLMPKGLYSDVDSTQVAFLVSLIQPEYAYNENFKEFEMAGMMQRCECYTEIDTNWHLKDIEAITVFDFDSEHKAGSRIDELIKCAIGYPLDIRNSSGPWATVDQLIESSEKIRFLTNYSFSRMLQFEFWIPDSRPNGLQQIRIKFIFKNGKSFLVDSPEFEFN